MTATGARFRYLGTTDDVVDCERPGCTQVDLKSTVVLVPLDEGDEGEPVYYGSTCAALVLGVRGGGRAVRQAATGARLETLMAAHDAVRMLRYYGLPVAGEVDHDTLRRAVRIYVRSNSGVTARVAETGVKVPDMVMDMVARKRAAIAEAVLVAGDDWVNDWQPLDYGFRREIERCQRQDVAEV